MITLNEIDESNWRIVANLSVTDEQKQYVASPMGILARAYAFRKDEARAYAISFEREIVGIVLIRNLDEEPSCYDLQQLLIDCRHQRKGYGEKALRLLICELGKANKYDNIEVCVDKNDVPALNLYRKVGFVDTGYVSPEVPNSLNLRYTLLVK